jgi:uroporphyrin-III C-methyltransferase/precorrin-2 dehydrogenase/sirohydrochlorin ferrochelatase
MTVSRKPLEEKPPSLGSLARLPVFLALDGKRAVFAGGSSAAAWKAELLSASGAQVQSGPSTMMKRPRNSPPLHAPAVCR